MKHPRNSMTAHAHHIVFLSVIALTAALTPSARGDQAGNTVIKIVGQEAGPTPLIVRLQLTIDQPATLTHVGFRIGTKTGGLARPLSATYSASYLVTRGYFDKTAGKITLPVFGLYSGSNNDVALTFIFSDRSSRQESTVIVTAPFADPCGYNTPEVLVPRTAATPLSYDYILIRNACGSSPVVIDTDGALRWVSPAASKVYSTIFFDGAIYLGTGVNLFRVELDGVETFLDEYSGEGVTGIHHNIDPGKSGILLQLNTTEQDESVIAEVDRQGKILQRWDFAEIISVAMQAGGDDPTQFVQPLPEDWFHSNATTYRAADDSLIVSSRENFVICVDYKTGAIKWILGDLTKRWAQFPSLRKYALTLPPESLPPIGQHSLSVLDDNNLLVFDNGRASLNHTPPGANRTYSAARTYRIDTTAGTATEIWNYENEQKLFSPFCSSAYRDTGLSYLLDYALLGPAGGPRSAQVIGLTSSGEQAFAYRYATDGCDTAFGAVPVHWEQLAFDAYVAPQPNVSLGNVSTRGVVRPGEEGLIAGFIISGTEAKQMLVRGLGPSLTGDGVSNAIADPVVSVHDAHMVVAANDNFDPATSPEGFIPEEAAESVVVVTLPPGAYTAVLSNKSGAEGVGLIEVYDLGTP